MIFINRYLPLVKRRENNTYLVSSHKDNTCITSFSKKLNVSLPQTKGGENLHGAVVKALMNVAG
jgi:hypothetical protein